MSHVALNVEIQSPAHDQQRYSDLSLRMEAEIDGEDLDKSNRIISGGSYAFANGGPDSANTGDMGPPTARSRQCRAFHVNPSAVTSLTNPFDDRDRRNVWQRLIAQPDLNRPPVCVA